MKQQHLIVAPVWGMAAALAVSLVFSCLGALLLERGVVPVGTISVLAWCISLLAGLAAGFLTAARTGTLRLPLALAAGAGYLLLAFVLRGLLFGTVGERPWLCVAFCAIGALLGAVAGAGRKGKGRRRR